MQGRRRVTVATVVVVIIVAVTAVAVAAGAVRYSDRRTSAGREASTARAGRSAPATTPGSKPGSPHGSTPGPIRSAPIPTATASAGDDEAAVAPVLAAATPRQRTDPHRVAARIGSVGGVKGATIGGAVWSPGGWVYGHGADTPLIPASTNKLLTSTAALQLLGPMHRFTTSVVAEPPSNGSSPAASASTRSIVLVGGGDPYLAGSRKSATDPGQASLEELAARTADRLAAQKVSKVRLGYDASLFAGPAWNPHWPDGYETSVTPTTALWADEGRLYGSIGPRQPDPAAAAAKLFAAQLGRKGIKVTGVAATTADRRAKPVASVPSLTLGQIIERLLMVSDNDAAEVLLRQVAIAAGRPGSITAGTQAVRQTLTLLGAWDGAARTYDGSGLARANRVPARLLAEVLQAAASGDRPALAPLLTGLPVAGVEGSLHYRFGAAGATAGRGLVRAKTGTLHGVHALAGYSYTRDGELLVYAFVVNGAKSDYGAVTWLDRVTAAVAGCGCGR